MVMGHGSANDQEVYGMHQRRWAVPAWAAVTALSVLVAAGACGRSGDTTARTPTTSTPSAAPQGTVWVAEEGGNALTAIDAATGRVVTTIGGISGPHNVQVSPDGSRVYAVSGKANAIARLDAGTYRLAASGPTGSGPAHVVLTPDGAKTYVTNFGDGSVSVYRTGDLTPTATIRIGGGPHGTRPTPDGTGLVVANLGAGTVDLIDTRTDKRTVAVPVDGPPVQVAVSPDSRYAYASITRPASIVKIGLRAGMTVARVAVSAAPAQVYLTPDGRTLLSADQGTEDRPGNVVSLINTESMTATGHITAGSGPHGIVVEPTGQRAWVTNMYDSTVSVLDLTARAAVATIRVGDEPNGISYSARPPAPAPARIDVVLPSPHATGDMHDHDMPDM
ncbi:hypothetical protein GCM10009682_45640 [Luedemannella flava]|uniref:YncE family protein n=2 Tax=Luedemannella flava TaxID=349316 RepID=A0ABP4YJB0_9ACTN